MFIMVGAVVKVLELADDTVFSLTAIEEVSELYKLY